MQLDRTRREEGQVTPALLLAVIGGFAIATAFLVLQNLLDQTDRGASASDAAALAAGKGFTDSLLAPGALSDPTNPLESLISLLTGSGDYPDLNQDASQYAEANGAELDGDVQVDPGAFGQWTFTVTTQQKDPVKDYGSDTSKGTSTSTVAVDLTGICTDDKAAQGILVDGNCISAAQYALDCIAPTPPTDPDPGNPGDPAPPGPTPKPPPAFQPKPYCGTDLLSVLKPSIHLTDTD